jgi:hypothetical protein
MSAKHTPGPWDVWLSHDARPHRIVGPASWRVAGAQCGTIVEVSHYGSGDVRYGPEQKANARLIASAPDLLEALGSLYALADGQKNYPAGSYGEAVMAHAEAAIRKATGEAA